MAFNFKTEFYDANFRQAKDSPYFPGKAVALHERLEKQFFKFFGDEENLQKRELTTFTKLAQLEQERETITREYQGLMEQAKAGAALQTTMRDRIRFLSFQFLDIKNILKLLPEAVKEAAELQEQKASKSGDPVAAGKARKIAVDARAACKILEENFLKGESKEAALSQANLSDEQFQLFTTNLALVQKLTSAAVNFDAKFAPIKSQVNMLMEGANLRALKKEDLDKYKLKIPELYDEAKEEKIDPVKLMNDESRKLEEEPQKLTYGGFLSEAIGSLSKIFKTYAPIYGNTILGFLGDTKADPNPFSRLQKAYAAVATIEYIDEPELTQKLVATGISPDVKLLNTRLGAETKLKLSMAKRAISFCHGAWIAMQYSPELIGKSAEIQKAMQQVFDLAQQFIEKTLAQKDFGKDLKAFKNYIDQEFNQVLRKIALVMANARGIQLTGDVKEKIIKSIEKDLIKGERLANWERRPTYPIATAMESDGRIYFNVDTPLNKLTAKQQNELDSIRSEKPPYWFKKLSSIEKNWWLENLELIKSGKFASPPSTYRSSPLASNFTKHSNVVFKGETLVSREDSIRRSTLPPIDIYRKTSSKTGPERNRLAAMIAEQVLTEANTQENFKNFWSSGAQQKLKFHGLHLDQSLLTPIPGLDRLPVEENNRRMRDETAKAVHGAAPTQKEQPVIVLATNWPLNSERALRGRDNCFNYSENVATKLELEKRYAEICTAVFNKIEGFSQASPFKENGEIDDAKFAEFFNWLKQHQNNLNLAFDEPHRLMKTKKFLIGIHALADFRKLWKDCNASNDSDHYHQFELRNIEVFAAGLTTLMVNGIGGTTSAGCKSAKDRMATNLVQVESMEQTYDEEGRLPQYTDTHQQRERFVARFARRYQAGHNQAVAGDNSYGCDACLEGRSKHTKDWVIMFRNGVAPPMIALDLQEAIGKELLATQNLLGKLNKPKIELADNLTKKTSIAKEPKTQELKRGGYQRLPEVKSEFATPVLPAEQLRMGESKRGGSPTKIHNDNLAKIQNAHLALLLQHPEKTGRYITASSSLVDDLNSIIWAGTEEIVVSSSEAGPSRAPRALPETKRSTKIPEPVLDVKSHQPSPSPPPSLQRVARDDFELKTEVKIPLEVKSDRVGHSAWEEERQRLKDVLQKMQVTLSESELTFVQQENLHLREIYQKVKDKNTTLFPAALQELATYEAKAEPYRGQSFNALKPGHDKVIKALSLLNSPLPQINNILLLIRDNRENKDNELYVNIFQEILLQLIQNNTELFGKSSDFIPRGGTQSDDASAAALRKQKENIADKKKKALVEVQIQANLNPQNVGRFFAQSAKLLQPRTKELLQERLVILDKAISSLKKGENPTVYKNERAAVKDLIDGLQQSISKPEVINATVANITIKQADLCEKCLTAFARSKEFLSYLKFAAAELSKLPFLMEHADNYAAFEAANVRVALVDSHLKTIKEYFAPDDHTKIGIQSLVKQLEENVNALEMLDPQHNQLNEFKALLAKFNQPFDRVSNHLESWQQVAGFGKYWQQINENFVHFKSKFDDSFNNAKRNLYEKVSYKPQGLLSPPVEDEVKKGDASARKIAHEKYKKEIKDFEKQLTTFRGKIKAEVERVTLLLPDQKLEEKYPGEGYLDLQEKAIAAANQYFEFPEAGGKKLTLVQSIIELPVSAKMAKQQADDYQARYAALEGKVADSNPIFNELFEKKPLPANLQSYLLKKRDEIIADLGSFDKLRHQYKQLYLKNILINPVLQELIAKYPNMFSDDINQQKAQVELFNRAVFEGLSFGELKKILTDQKMEINITSEDFHKIAKFNEITQIFDKEFADPAKFQQLLQEQGLVVSNEAIKNFLAFNRNAPGISEKLATRIDVLAARKRQLELEKIEADKLQKIKDTLRGEYLDKLYAFRNRIDLIDPQLSVTEADNLPALQAEADRFNVVLTSITEQIEQLRTEFNQFNILNNDPLQITYREVIDFATKKQKALNASLEHINILKDKHAGIERSALGDVDKALQKYEAISQKITSAIKTATKYATSHDYNLLPMLSEIIRSEKPVATYQELLKREEVSLGLGKKAIAKYLKKIAELLATLPDLRVIEAKINLINDQDTQKQRYFLELLKPLRDTSEIDAAYNQKVADVAGRNILALCADNNLLQQILFTRCNYGLIRKDLDELRADLRSVPEPKIFGTQKEELKLTPQRAMTYKTFKDKYKDLPLNEQIYNKLRAAEQAAELKGVVHDYDKLESELMTAVEATNTEFKDLNATFKIIDSSKERQLLRQAQARTGRNEEQQKTGKIGVFVAGFATHVNAYAKYCNQFRDHYILQQRYKMIALGQNRTLPKAKKIDAMLAAQQTDLKRLYQYNQSWVKYLNDQADRALKSTNKLLAAKTKDREEDAVQNIQNQLGYLKHLLTLLPAFENAQAYGHLLRQLIDLDINEVMARTLLDKYTGIKELIAHLETEKTALEEATEAKESIKILAGNNALQEVKRDTSRTIANEDVLETKSSSLLEDKLLPASSPEEKSPLLAAEDSSHELPFEQKRESKHEKVVFADQVLHVLDTTIDKTSTVQAFESKRQQAAPANQNINSPQQKIHVETAFTRAGHKITTDFNEKTVTCRFKNKVSYNKETKDAAQNAAVNFFKLNEKVAYIQYDDEKLCRKTALWIRTIDELLHGKSMVTVWMEYKVDGKLVIKEYNPAEKYRRYGIQRDDLTEIREKKEAIAIKQTGEYSLPGVTFEPVEEHKHGMSPSSIQNLRL